MTTPGRVLIALSTALLASLAVFTATAGAASMVFIKKGDVWLSKPNGKSARAITKNGRPGNPYRSPSISNKGVIAAVKGRRDVYFFNRRGRRLRKPRTLPTLPPYDVVIVDQAISPDGRRLASTIWLTTRDATPKPGEPQGTDYGTHVVYTRVKDGKEIGRTRDGQHTTWATSSTPVVFAPYVYHSADAWVVNLSNPDSPRQWFQDRKVVDVLDPSDGEPLNDGELTRGHDKVAVVRGPSTTASSAPTMVRVYAMSNLSDRPTERCDLRSAPNTRIESPTWTPDGRRLAWSERSGIWSTRIAAGVGDCQASPKRLVRGGSQPDFAPANVPKRRR
jgi:hypothetical protein